MSDTPTPRSLTTIAYDVKRHWSPVYFGAVPYLDAMTRLDTLNDYCMNDRADTIVRYFLANAKFWCGPDAKRIKAELRSMLGAR